MTTWIKVARFHLVDRFSYTAMPWAALAIAFVINLAIADAERGGGGSTQIATGAVAAIYVFFFAVGILNISQSLPFAFALGVSRRSYYVGTVMLAVSLAAVYGLALALLQVIEQASDGWGVALHFFRVGYILPGPWYLTWLTSFVLLTLTFVFGMWVGLIFRRWGMLGLLACALPPVAALVVGIVVISNAQAWPSIGQFFTTLSTAGFTGLLAALAVVLVGGGYATMRRVTV
jgi:hypothetical protein